MRLSANGQRLVFVALIMHFASLPAAAKSTDEGPGSSVNGSASPDVAAGAEKSKVCIACHGEKGISRQDNYPHLHGQKQTYLLRQMRNFRDGGDRRDPIMTPMLQSMSDADLVNLAAYYASFDSVLSSPMQAPTQVGEAMPTPTVQVEAPPAQPVPADASDMTVAAVVPAVAAAAPESVPGDVAKSVAVGVAEDGQAKAAACAACHGADGRGTTPLFPNLHDQKAEYLARQLEAFRAGTRQDPTMAPMATTLSDQDIADLAAYYGSLK